MLDTIQTTDDQKISPMMIQWHACKKKIDNALLFFRMGDFYEAFYDDAIIMAKELELTLTKRQEIPMCGVPHHTQENYVDRLVAKGYRVAIAEQIEDPRKAKGLVKRDVVRVVTPGSVINSSLLSEKCHNFIASVSRVGQLFGLAILDLTTADFFVIEVTSEHDLQNEIYRLQPSEFVVSPKIYEKNKLLFDEMRKNCQSVVSTHPEWHFEHQNAHDFLMQHFKVRSLDGFGLQGMVAAINAAGGLLNYLQESLCHNLSHITEIQLYSTSQYMMIDRATQRHLELSESLNGSSKQHTLLHVLDNTRTPMGARLLRQWLKQPLLSIQEIVRRQDAIQTFFHHPYLLNDCTEKLECVRDLERLMMKIYSGYASPRDLVALKISFDAIPSLKSILATIMDGSSLLLEETNSIETLPEMNQLISNALVAEPPMRLNEGKIFRTGYCQELDELREISQDSKTWLARYQNELKEKTGIKTLKVGFNRMFGYYIEVSKGQAEKMPESFQRRQTLVNAERFITPELKTYEGKMMHAEERIIAIENELFVALREQIIAFGQKIQRTAQAIAQIDALQSLAFVALERNYIRPLVDESAELKISNGRHPVIESTYASERFIANDTLLDDTANRLLLITGPNMAGKSTYIRQVALITIMAQMGSFVPASYAHIGIVDKVFSRIGASDNLANGHSTFMVEMTETANILNNATSRSLIILDEIGRGTSTYDGIAIAWAVAEYLLITEGRMAKTLFATHYWELTKLEEKIPGAINYNVAVHETQEGIIFLRKIMRGGTDKSYGIHVARLAGLPSPVLIRAQELLMHLEENSNRKNAFEPSPVRPPISKQKKRIPVNDLQMNLFEMDL